MATRLLLLAGLLASCVIGVLVIYFSLMSFAAILRSFKRSAQKARERREEALLLKKEKARLAAEGSLSEKKSLETQVASLQKDIASFKAAEEKSRREVLDLSQKVRACEKTLQEKNDACAAYAAREAALNSRLSSLAQRSDELERLKRDHDNLNRQFLDLKKAAQDAQLESQRTQGQLEKTAQTLKTREGRLFESEAQQKKLLQEIDALKKAAPDQEAQRGALAKQLVQLEEAYKRVLNDNEDLKVQLGLAQAYAHNKEKEALASQQKERSSGAEVASLRKVQEEISRAKKENEALTDQLAKLRIKNEVTLADAETLRRELKEAREAERRQRGKETDLIKEKDENVGKLKEEMKRLEDALAVQEARCRELEGRAQGHEALKQQLERAKNDKEKLERDLKETLEKQKRELERAGETKKASEVLAQGHEALKQQLERAKKDKEKLERDLTVLRREEDASRKDLTSLSQELKGLKEAYEKQRQELERSGETRKASEALKQESAAKLHGLEEELKRSAGRESQLADKLKELEGAKAQIQQQHKEMTVLKADLENEVRELKDLLKQEQAGLKELGSTKQGLEKELAQANQELESLRAQVAAAQNAPKELWKTVELPARQVPKTRSESWQAWVRRFTLSHMGGDRIWITRSEFDEVADEMEKKDTLLEKFTHDLSTNSAP